MTVYVVKQESKLTGGVRVSQEGYRSKEDAQAFVKGRADAPFKIKSNGYVFENLYYTYEIVEVSIK